MKQLEVQIMGQSYLLGCPAGGESRLLDAVERVDTAMCKIRDAGKVRARDRIAVLAALNLAFDLADKAPTLAAPAATAAAKASSNAAHASADNQEPSAELAFLLTRLDDVLSEDGRLL
jgi:cell division protein ZapA